MATMGGEDGHGIVATALAVVACGSTTPSPAPGETPTPTPTPTAAPTVTAPPTPTPVPTPLPTLPAVEPTAFRPGWTVAASSTNVGEEPGTKLHLDDRADLLGRRGLHR